MAHSLWQLCIQELRNTIQQDIYTRLITPLQVEEASDTLTLFVPNNYVLEGITREVVSNQKTLYSIIQEILGKFNQSIAVKVTTHPIPPAHSNSMHASMGQAGQGGQSAYSHSGYSQSAYSHQGHGANGHAGHGGHAASHSYSGSGAGVQGGGQIISNLNPSFTFENFVEGKSNQLAKAAAMQVAENPGGAYNPLFLYGGVGLGKTHLMQAAGNFLVEKRRASGKDVRVLYLHSERFVGEMVKALQENAINEFKRRYRTLDALLIDDIQFFAGKERSQEEFFHTFNALLEGQQQIILTSDRYPKEINGIEERLKSRFGSGLTVAVQPPELETRVAILMNKAEQCNINLSHEVAFFIAKRIRSNVRELEGALKRVIANAQFTGSQINLEFVQEALKDLLAIQDKLVSIDNIIKTVAEYYKVKISELLSKRRNRSVARPRQVAMALCKELTNHSLPEIGDAFGGRDHTTVMHACQKIRELTGMEADISEDFSNLVRILST